MAAISRLFFAGLIAISQAGCEEPSTAKTLATVLALEGPAEVSADNGSTFAPLHLSDNPGHGSLLRTLSGSRLSLALLPNCLLHLDSDTTLKIVELALAKDGNETGSDVRGRFADIQLTDGRLLVSHAWGEATARLSIATTNGNVSTPSNALFWVEIAGGKTRVTCVTGWVEFEPPSHGQSTRIPPGFIGEWPSPDDRLIAASAEARGQDDLQQALEDERQLGDLLARRRNILPR